jgi:hypothetical protein
MGHEGLQGNFSLRVIPTSRGCCSCYDKNYTAKIYIIVNPDLS